MKKFKSILFASAFMIALAGTFAFNLPGKTVKKSTVYHYDSEVYSLAEMQDIDNWQPSGPECDVVGDFPCAIDYDGENFQAFLNGFSTEEALTSAIPERRSLSK